MSAAEIIDKITDAGGRIWLSEGKVRAILPEALRPLVTLVQSQKAELIAELSRRPPMPAGLRLVRWAPKMQPVQLSRCETAVDVDAFIRSTLRQVDARLRGRNWQAGNWTLSTLLDRLAACGCDVELVDPKVALH